ncbi:hypothetical protein [Kiritimatiella glycovorans]|uniref:Amidohydrolase family protein n=1 Tax=Kiritimatiella glycovorans TaxID=1307763 RepID=A0A0G3EEV9_9BACT|nr:hypothetical protein [Kiritimatiella glycovorans]AKJ63942.1 Amidohydrolase family protein [Kiritimatiella glycovorans]
MSATTTATIPAACECFTTATCSPPIHVALAAASTNDRARLYVLEACLIDPDRGRIAAVYPFLDEPGPDDPSPQALPLGDTPALQDPCPDPPGTDPATVLAAWRAEGIDEALLTDLDCIDLRGAVVTPGIIDSHFHVTSWSKKIPEQGEQFGYFADVSDPHYTIDKDTHTQRGIREGLEMIVDDANTYLDSHHSRTGMLLHGYVRTEVDEAPADPGHPDTCLYLCSTQGCAAATLNPRYLINGIGRGADPTHHPEAALLVHTSGQVCWYNGELHRQYNDGMRSSTNRFGPTDVETITAPGDEDTLWTLEVAMNPDYGTNLFLVETPFLADVVVTRTGEPGPAHIPLEVVETAGWSQTVRASLLMEELDALLTNGWVSAHLIPLYRVIPACISETAWQDAADFWGRTLLPAYTAYGCWDPYRPYESNWYSGAERGLVEYFHDVTGRVWRASGYAEHYVMRDALGSVVQRPPDVGDGMRFRRNLARWCHRHGITGVHDIMFYRRSTNREEFQAYEALSHERNPAVEEEFFTRRGLDTTTRTGEFNLRVGLYYYVENMEQIDDVLTLATGGDDGPDPDRLAPKSGHREYPGWVRWLGWKLQLDGGTGARTLFSSAPMAKSSTSHAFVTTNTAGEGVVFRDHAYGLLTMTSEQEQVFNSRECAALYWLVRECVDGDPGFRNTAITNDWTFLKEGVGYWPEIDFDPALLAQDLRLLDHVDMTVSIAGTEAAAGLAEKLRRVFVQVDSGYLRTLGALARIRHAHDAAVTNDWPIPGQVACHNLGDGGVDLYTRCLWTLKDDLETLPTSYKLLPGYWKNALGPDDDLTVIRRGFTNERYRIEHLLNVSPYAINLIRNPRFGMDRESLPTERNVVFSVQPALLAVDGQSIRVNGFPDEQELWEIPTAGMPDFWRGVPARPRSEHHKPCPLYLDYDIPFALNTDPPSVRDPRPAITMIGAVARCPIEADPGRWLDQGGEERPEVYPAEYLAGKVFPPLGHREDEEDNPMQLSVEQALSAMTFWAAYHGGLETELGAIAPTNSMPDGPGWYADLVVWRTNPFAIEGPDGLHLADLAHPAADLSQSNRVEMVNTFIERFRPALTLVGGMPVYRATRPAVPLQGEYYSGEE